LVRALRVVLLRGNPLATFACQAGGAATSKLIASCGFSASLRALFASLFGTTRFSCFENLACQAEY
jgi:hypothetical protein